LDSPIGLHEGGQISAPVFSRVAQQVLAYLNVPHDVEFQDPKRLMLRARIKDEDVAEGSAERIVAEVEPLQAPAPAVPEAPAAQPKSDAHLVAAAYKQTPAPNTTPAPSTGVASTLSTSSAPVHANGTVVLDVAGGVVVPDFTGKPLRAALEEAQTLGIELEVSGSGVGRTQSPLPGSKVPHGGHVSVSFSR